MNWFQRLLYLFRVITGGSSTPPPPLPPGPPPVPDAMSPLEAALLQAHNTTRAFSNLPPLTYSATLAAAARQHANWMAVRGVMSHTGDNNTSVSDRIRAAGYQASRLGENIAAGYTSVEAVMQGWLKSPGHKRNILGAYTEIGLGHAQLPGQKLYWCVVLAVPAGRSPVVWAVDCPGGLNLTDTPLAG